MKACGYCGRENDQEATHCRECGTSFIKERPKWMPATGALHKFILRATDKVRMPHDPSPLRRDAVVRFLSQRPTLSDVEWHRRYAAPLGISLDFVIWFRDMCSDNFDYDLSAALPEDRLFEDLGLNDATWGDVALDILEDFEARFGVKLPDEVDSPITTFGKLLEFFWKYAQTQTHAG
jgi:hypothetical protein